MGHEGLQAAAKRAWESQEFSDLIVRCKGRDFNVHKFVVCLQSDFFANTVKGDAFEEGQTGIIKMDNDDSSIVAAALEFLYTSDYSSLDQNDQEGKHPILFHIDMYAIADRIQNGNLKSLAEDKFNEVAQTAWKDPEFSTAVHSVYEVTPPGPKGDRLRSLVAQVSANHSKVLFKKDQDFSTMMESIADFGRDLAKVLSVTACSNSQQFRCPKLFCGFDFRVEQDSIDLDILTCPACAKKSSLSLWS